MRVIENNEKNTVDFAELEEGDCFRWEGDLYVKSDTNQEGVCLENGYAIEDMCGEQVTPVNAEVHIIN